MSEEKEKRKKKGEEEEEGEQIQTHLCCTNMHAEDEGKRKIMIHRRKAR